jgi:hypothetical protein
VYLLGDGPASHPLETILVGVAATGNWLEDVQITLGVSEEWIDGFLAGFAHGPDGGVNADYSQGFLAAELLRTTHFRRQLPDRR